MFHTKAWFIETKSIKVMFGQMNQYKIASAQFVSLKHLLCIKSAIGYDHLFGGDGKLFELGRKPLVIFPPSFMSCHVTEKNIAGRL